MFHLASFCLYSCWPSCLSRSPLSSPKRLKCYQRVGVAIKVGNFKGLHLCRGCSSTSSRSNLAGARLSKVNKCEIGHVFAIRSLCHTCSLFSVINIPPTPGPRSLCAGRPAKTLPWPPGTTHPSKPTLPVHLRSIGPIGSLSGAGWQDPARWVYSGRLCSHWWTVYCSSLDGYNYSNNKPTKTGSCLNLTLQLWSVPAAVLRKSWDRKYNFFLLESHEKRERKNLFPALCH